MARIYLVSCNMTADPYPVYPLGMSLVANAAAEAGHCVRQADLYAGGGIEAVAADLRRFEPRLIGLSLRNIDDVCYPSPAVYAKGYRSVVQAFRSRSDAPIVLGGSAFTIYPDELLDITGADFGVAGEGEAAFLELAASCGLDPEPGPGPGRDRKEGRAENAGRIFRGSRRLTGDEACSFNRDPFLADFYLHNGGMLSIQTKRGCPHTCAYCSYPHLEGRAYRFRSPQSVADEIEFLIGEYNADYLAVTDSVFNDAEGVYLQVCEEIVRRDIKIPWMCYLRPQKFSDQEVRLLKRAGLSSVEWGTDCSTDETLAGMGKPFGWDEVTAANEQFARAGIPGSHFIMFGGPGETMDTVNQGLGNLASLDGCVVFAGIGVRVFPDTPIYGIMRQEHGISAASPGALGDGPTRPVFYLSPGIDPQGVDTRIRESFAGRMDRIYGDGGFGERVAAFHKLGYRGPIWDYLLKQPAGRRRRRSRA